MLSNKGQSFLGPRCLGRGQDLVEVRERTLPPATDLKLLDEMSLNMPAPKYLVSGLKSLVPALQSHQKVSRRDVASAFPIMQARHAPLGLPIRGKSQKAIASTGLACTFRDMLRGSILAHLHREMRWLRPLQRPLKSMLRGPDERSNQVCDSPEDSRSMTGNAGDLARAPQSSGSCEFDHSPILRRTNWPDSF